MLSGSSGSNEGLYYVELSLQQTEPSHDCMMADECRLLLEFVNDWRLAKTETTSGTGVRRWTIRYQ